MSARWIWLALVLSVSPSWCEGPVPRTALSYSAASIVNGASFRLTALAPNTIASLFGTELSFTTVAISDSDIRGGAMPNYLPRTGVTLNFGGQPAGLYYVSPTQINFVVPANVLPGKYKVRVSRNGLAGPEAEVEVAAAMPAAFQQSETLLLAARNDTGLVVNAEQPARCGEILVLYATGLGETAPSQIFGRLASGAAWITSRSTFRLHINGEPLPPEFVHYVGVTPGFAGLYQINFTMPPITEADPEIILDMNGALSPSGLRLPALPDSCNPDDSGPRP